MLKRLQVPLCYNEDDATGRGQDARRAAEGRGHACRAADLGCENAAKAAGGRSGQRHYRRMPHAADDEVPLPGLGVVAYESGAHARGRALSAGHRCEAGAVRPAARDCALQRFLRGDRARLPASGDALHLPPSLRQEPQEPGSVGPHLRHSGGKRRDGYVRRALRERRRRGAPRGYRPHSHACGQAASQ